MAANNFIYLCSIIISNHEQAVIERQQRRSTANWIWLQRRGVNGNLLSSIYKFANVYILNLSLKIIKMNKRYFTRTFLTEMLQLFSKKPMQRDPNSL